MERVLKPMLMDEEEGARAYAASDFSVPHDAFVRRFEETFPDFAAAVRFGGFAADLGCGNADISIRFAKAYSTLKIIGMDGSESMLELGAKSLYKEDLVDRIILSKTVLPNHGYLREFDAVISNSLLHHLDDQNIMWDSVKSLAIEGAPVFIVDLTRPHSETRASEIVRTYAQGEPEIMKRDFYNSLLSAFRPEEARVGLDKAGLERFKVEVVSDRHMAIYGKI
jgi:SAM-dependent methyltransferase